MSPILDGAAQVTLWRNPSGFRTNKERLRLAAAMFDAVRQSSISDSHDRRNPTLGGEDATGP
jgi:hypothetical protein